MSARFLHKNRRRFMISRVLVLSLVFWSCIWRDISKAAESADAQEPQWIPDSDVLDLIWTRMRWRMSVEEFREMFREAELEELDWSLARGSFRKKITLHYPNTRAVFEFSGVVDNASTNVVAVSSSLVSFQIIHPVKQASEIHNKSWRQSIHYQYLKRLHDAFRARLDAVGTQYRHEEMVLSDYFMWQLITSEVDGKFAFTYWNNTGP